MTAVPIWFGPADRRLFGWFHCPADGHARGGAVVCPPLGRDSLQAHYALRRLATRLEAAGYAVVRFDYDGTGDSVGAFDDPGRVTAWLHSVAAAVEVVRSSGAGAVTLVGMRLGATLAAVAAGADGAVDGLVLWDPCGSGRSFLTEQRALASLTLRVAGTRPDGSVETPGLVYTAETARDVRALRITDEDGPLARRILVLSRQGSPAAELHDLARSAVEWDDATGQAELMDVGSPYQVLPDAAIDRIVEWLARDVGERHRVDVPGCAPVAVVDHDTRGGAITEHFVALGRLGLFGIVTEPPDQPSGPTVLLLSVANEHHIGPSRLWVEFARRFAAVGIRSVRFDLSGLGDSPTRPGQPEFVARAPEAFDDVLDAARAVSPCDASDVVLMGLCSAAYQALESGLELVPRAVVALNPVLSFQPPEMLAGAAMHHRRRVCLPRNRAIEAFHGDGTLSPLLRRFPDLGWQFRNRLAGRRRPAKWLAALARLHVPLLLVCGDREHRQVTSATPRRLLAQLEASGDLRLEYIPDLDHGLLVASHRQEVGDMVTNQLMAWAETPCTVGS